MPFHSGIVNPILDIIGQIQGFNTSTTALSNYPPAGSTQIGDQMTAIAWGVAGGIPIVGIYITGIGYVTGADSNMYASLATMGLTSAGLYYLWPRGAVAAWEWTMYGLGASTGYGPPLWGPYQTAWRVPMWAKLSFVVLWGYGVWKAYDELGKNLPKAVPVGGPAPFGG